MIRSFKLGIAVLILTVLSILSSAQSTIQAKKTSVPPSIIVKGAVKEAWEWSDIKGNNILVLSVKGPFKEKDAEGQEGITNELYATHYYLKENNYKVLWQTSDFIKQCTLDYDAEFIKGSTSISDLDNDGIAETIVQYKTACHGDVSPAYMKLIMHEDTVKYALRGTMWLEAAATPAKMKITEKDVNLELSAKRKDDYEYAMGRYESEKDFIKAPASFISYARKRWLKFVKDTL